MECQWVIVYSHKWMSLQGTSTGQTDKPQWHIMILNTQRREEDHLHYRFEQAPEKFMEKHEMET